MYMIFGLVFLFAISLAAWGETDLKPKKSQFREVCRNLRQLAPESKVEAPEVGVSSYFPVTALEATQTRFSYSRFLTSLEKAVREEPNWLAHDRARALYSMTKKIKVVHYRGKLYIVDGHHRALISTYMGAQTIPAQIIADLSELSRDQFIADMESRGWAHWRDHEGQQMTPVDLCEMQDDPNFQLVRLLIRRVTVTLEEGRLRITKSTGSKTPVAVKINGDIPFFENHLADALRRGGVEHDDRRNADEFSKRELVRYLEILQETAAMNSSPLAKVLLLDKPRDVAKLDLEQIVFKHMRDRSCEHDLK